MTHHAPMNRAGTPKNLLALSVLAGVIIAGCSSSREAEPGVSHDPVVVDRALSGSESEESGVRATPVVLSEQEWCFAGRDGVTIRTPHYRLYTTESDEVLRERMPLFLEHAIAHYRTAVGDLPAPPAKLDTYLMDNRPQRETLSKRLHGDQSGDILQIQRGGYAARGVGGYFDIGLYDTLSIAAHEGWHQYTQRTFRDPLPIWLEEGLATFMEGHAWRSGRPVFRSWQNLERFNALANASASGNLYPLQTLVRLSPNELITSDPEGLLRYYAQVWALTHFLAYGQGGMHAEALARALDDAVEGELTDRLIAAIGRPETSRSLGSRLGDGVLRAYVGTAAASLDEAYQAFIARLTRTGARDAISSGRSPI